MLVPAQIISFHKETKIPGLPDIASKRLLNIKKKKKKKKKKNTYCNLIYFFIFFLNAANMNTFGNINTNDKLMIIFIPRKKKKKKTSPFHANFC